jgi:hypothetical protein
MLPTFADAQINVTCWSSDCDNHSNGKEPCAEKINEGIQSQPAACQGKILRHLSHSSHELENN